MAKLRWYAARLAAMSPPEIVHRLREAVLKRQAKGDRRGWTPFAAAAPGPMADLALLRQRLIAAAPLAGEAHVGQTLTGLGVSVDATLGAAAFLVDPVSRSLWPGAERYCFDIDVRSTGAGRGDVKFVWEINRMQFLHPVAARIAAAPDTPLIDEVFAVLETWADANPPFAGVNWFSGIELAMRMVTITLVAAAVSPERMGPERTALLGRLVAAHAYWLHRYPSRYSSANNHLVAEGLGLLLAGLLFPAAAHADIYRAEGRTILEREADLQILPDGVGAEQSPTYQAFTMEMLAFGALVAESTGAPLAGSVTDRLVAGAQFLRTLMDDAGTCPHIGDDDEGRVIGCPPDREPRYVASVVAAVAGLAGRPDLAPPGRDAHLRDALFCAPAEGAAASDGLHVFAEGGYSIARIREHGRCAVLTFDHGPLGYLKLSAHGHADTLALWLSVDDQPVLVDAGTYLYHSGGAMRNRLRSSLAHNTLTIGEASSSVPSSAFSWGVRAHGRLISRTDALWWTLQADHDGYLRRHGIRHRRTVAREPGGLLVTDQLDGATGDLPVRIGFVLHPDVDCVIEAERAVLTRNGTALVTLGLPAALRALMVRGDSEQGMGLYSPCFNTLEATRHLVLTGTMGAAPVTTRITIDPVRG